MVSRPSRPRARRRPHPTEPVLTTALATTLTTALMTKLNDAHHAPPLLVPTGELEALLGLPDARTIPKVVRLMRYLEQTGA